jgi:flavin-dependent dehydrogenase
MIAPTFSLEEAVIRFWDALIVGAGPAGAMAARELACRGLMVLLVDRASFPRWKVCGACLNERALQSLAQAGMSSLASRCRAVPLTNLYLAARGRRAALPLPGGAALSRESFDAALILEAIAMGAAFLPETYATLGGSNSSGRLIFLRQAKREQTAVARIVIAADGLSGRFIAGEPGIRSVISRDSRIGAGTIVTGAPDYYEPGKIYMACGTDGYVGLVRLEDERLGVAAALDWSTVQRAGGPAQLAAQVLADTGWPQIPRLEALTWRGTPRLTRRPSRLSGDRLFVIGDSAGYVEPFTGEGIAWALESALALAPVAVQATRRWASRYAATWTSAYRRVTGARRTCRAAARVLRFPFLTRGIIGLLGRFPALGQPVIHRINRRPSSKAAPL